LKSEGEVTSLSGADKREVRDNREKWWEYREKSKYFSSCTTSHSRGIIVALEITVKKKWTIWMFALPTAIYTHGPGLTSHSLHSLLTSHH
jgi:hypothetical protein